jgi:monofunctional glycosyltransferase
LAETHVATICVLRLPIERTTPPARLFLAVGCAARKASDLKDHWAKEHWAVDERARDEERTVSGTSCGAEPAARAPEPSRRVEANGPQADEKAAALGTEVPHHLLLPRAAGGGAGAVAALNPEVRWGAAELLPGRLAQADGAAREPEILRFPAPLPAQIAAKPGPTEATLAIEIAPKPAPSVEFAPAAITPADVAAADPAASEVEPNAADAGALPEPSAALPIHRAPQAGFEPATAESVARASEGSHAAQAPAQSPTPKEVGPTPADGATPPAEVREDAPFPQTGPALEDRLTTNPVRAGVAGLIPQVRPTPPALPPSVAPALAPVEVEPARIEEPPDATARGEAVAPVAEAVAETVPALLRPPTNPPLHPLTPAEPQLMGIAPAIPAPPPIPARELPAPYRDKFGLERRHVRVLLGAGLALLIGVGGLLMILLLLYRWVDPPASTLMLSQRFAGSATTQRWIPLERMSPNLVAAVIASEDGHFCRHHGVDWGELREAIESAGDGLARGGSTISMQVVKNLFLWPSRSYVRKAIEIPLAYSIEALWPKRRILEIYLNVAEWGPGIFGAEAAARYHFRKPALLLTAREAALLAVSLPNPLERQAGRPGPGTLRLADNLLLRMKAAQASTACLRTPPHGGG